MISLRSNKLDGLNIFSQALICSNEIGSIWQRVVNLLSEEHRSLPNTSGLIQATRHDLDEVLRLAFGEEHPHALLDIHKTLFLIYETHFAHPLSKACLHQNSPWLLDIRNTIEDVWLDYEIRKINQHLPRIYEDASLDLFRDWFSSQAHSLSSTDRKILSFLRDEASVDEFNMFILSDAPLNYRFFDTLALSLIYFSEEIKLEIIKNIWDECGHGLIENFHTQKFTSMLTKLGLSLPSLPIWKDWRPYSGYNLNLCFALSRKYYFRGIGSLVMPELFDPERNRYVVTGLERLYSSKAKIDCEYFYNHIEADVEHGSHWLNRIVIPIAKTNLQAGNELAIGAALRMEAMRRYNQYLASIFNLNCEEE